jgi:hypothetical protein
MEQAKKDNIYLKGLLEADKPFYVGRIAGVELKIAYYVQNNMVKEYQNELESLERNAGIYTKDEESLRAYTSQLIQSYDHCTVIAEWEKRGGVYSFHGLGQELITRRTPHIPKIDALALEPYYYDDSWMSALRGKRILIIHPFVQTIQKQIKHISELFPKREWFQDCTFVCLSPPVTLAGNHRGKDWREHYGSFLETLNQTEEFDVALVAAGGYGMLISDYIYTTLQKSVLYIGGALQIFFGIIGKRWFENKKILEMVNDDWVRPSSSEKPPNCIQVEKGCYW